LQAQHSGQIGSSDAFRGAGEPSEQAQLQAYVHQMQGSSTIDEAPQPKELLL